MAYVRASRNVASSGFLLLSVLCCVVVRFVLDVRVFAAQCSPLVCVPHLSFVVWSADWCMTGCTSTSDSLLCCAAVLGTLRDLFLIFLTFATAVAQLRICVFGSLSTLTLLQLRAQSRGAFGRKAFHATARRSKEGQASASSTVTSAGASAGFACGQACRGRRCPLSHERHHHEEQQDVAHHEIGVCSFWGDVMEVVAV